MRTFAIDLPTAKIHAAFCGKGKRLLLCFHGFEQDASSFECLEAALGEEYIIVAVDLPYHGFTVWDKKHLEWNDLQQAIEIILNQFGQKKFSLLGYSMGGRLSLFITQQMGERLEELILIAPDGIKSNPWHSFATQTIIGNWLFRYNIGHPAIFFGLLKAGKKIGTTDERLYRFASQSMDSFAKRKKVYDVWTCMKNIWPQIKKVKKIIRQNNIKTFLFFGKYDRVITPAIGASFCKNLDQTKLVVLEKGHNLLSAELAAIISEKLESWE